MKKEPLIRTNTLLPESIRKKARQISKKKEGVESVSAGIRIAIRAYKLKEK